MSLTSLRKAPLRLLERIRGKKKKRFNEGEEEEEEECYNGCGGGKMSAGFEAPLLTEQDHKELLSLLNQNISMDFILEMKEAFQLFDKVRKKVVGTYNLVFFCFFRSSYFFRFFTSSYFSVSSFRSVFFSFPFFRPSFFLFFSSISFLTSFFSSLLLSPFLSFSHTLRKSLDLGNVKLSKSNFCLTLYVRRYSLKNGQ